MATEAPALPRGHIHGGGSEAPMRYSAAIETAADGASSTESPVSRRSTWRATLVGALVGLLIAMALLMKWLMEYQVITAAERRVQETAARAAAARCFELKSNSTANACLKALEARSNPVN
ncbi:hypothetical protein J2X92_004860 [Variovorax paradoxus]|nr:hypothetical protein [Variovorax paradoxus]